MEYEEIQANEVEALKAIYASDFQEIESKAVWNKKPSPKFTIKLRPSSEFETSPIRIQIQVTMTQTYPKTLPKVELLQANALSGRQTEALKNCIEETVKELKGSEMIFEVTSNLQTRLDEWARSVSEAAPNLEEDRLRRIRSEERKQKEQQDNLQKEREAEAMKRENQYKSLILEELKRSEVSDAKTSWTSKDPDRLILLPESTSGVTTFSKPIELSQVFSDTSHPVVFRQVLSILKMRQSFCGPSFMAKALVPPVEGNEENEPDTVLLLNCVILTSEYWHSSPGIKSLQSLDNELSVIRQCHHPGILPLCGYNMSKSHGPKRQWELTILTPYSKLVPLENILESTDSISLRTAQLWLLQILEALDSLHKNGLRHRCICLQNAVIKIDSETGETSMMLRHPQYLYTLHCLNTEHKFKEHTDSGNERYGTLDPDSPWLPPEGRGRALPAAPSSKWDIWQFGALLVTMIAGKRALAPYKDDVEAYWRAKSRQWPREVSDLVNSTLSRDPFKRPGALELLTDQFFRCNFDTYGEDRTYGRSAPEVGSNPTATSASDVATLASSSTATLLPRQNPETTRLDSDLNTFLAPPTASTDAHAGRRRLSSGEESNNTFSRYKQDFDEGIVLGRGGFGQVVKARNKLDGRVYAVKKVRATPSTLSHILQEVVLLSRLNHQYVVRYYTVWLEDELEPAEEEGSISKIDPSIEEESSKAIQDSLSRPPVLSRDSSRANIPNSMQSTSLSQFSAHHSLSELDIPSASQDFMSDSGFVEFGFSDSDEDALIDVSGSESSMTDTPHPDSNVRNENLVLDRIRHGLINHEDRSDARGPMLNKLTRIAHKTLYIQMEYCENHTLGDLIRQNLSADPSEYWRLLRQILEALAYIHGEGVIHRDLKPKNIFIDQGRNIKIGDFGLARSMVQPLQSRQHSIEPNSLPVGVRSSTDARAEDEDLTTDIGTSLYSAVEITAANYPKRGYNEKVDIFSLGIIFFEMVWKSDTEMERIQNIRRIRAAPCELPKELSESKDLAVPADLIKSMLRHEPSQRPSALGLLESGMIPVEERNMTVQEALRNVRDPHIVQQLTNALFSRPLTSAQQVLYDRVNPTASTNRQLIPVTDSKRTLALEYVETVLESVFRSHGAINNTSLRSQIFPRSSLYKAPAVVELLDSQGTLLQLPHDLILPHARRLAEIVPEYKKAYAIDTVFRSRPQNPGLHPAKHVEVDFDIVSIENDQTSLILDEAETIAVMYDSANAALNKDARAGDSVNDSKTQSENFSNESVSQLESDAAETNLAIVLGHHDILSAILSHSGLNPPQYIAALSRLNAGSTERRGSVLQMSNVPATSMDMLSQFNFREPLNQAETRMSRLMPLSERVRSALERIYTVTDILKRLCATAPEPEIYFSPLMHNATSEFYINGIMFQLIETKYSKGPTRQLGLGSVLAVGGRYDSLIKSFRNSVLDSRTQLAKAVGFGMSAEKLVSLVLKEHVQQHQNRPHLKAIVPPRCQVLVSSLSETSLKEQGLETVKLLWRHGINADLVRNATSAEDAVVQAMKECIPIIVIVKQMHAQSNANNKFKPLRVRRLNNNCTQVLNDTDIKFSELAQFVFNELGMSGNGSSDADGGISNFGDGLPNVEFDNSSDRVLILNELGKLKGGRKNKWQLEERSVEARTSFLKELNSMPIVSLDLRDDVIEAITSVAPQAAEDWKRRVVGLSPNQKAYIMSVQAKLANEATRTPRMLLYSSKSENVFIYNY